MHESISISLIGIGSDGVYPPHCSYSRSSDVRTREGVEPRLDSDPGLGVLDPLHNAVVHHI